MKAFIKPNPTNFSNRRSQDYLSNPEVRQEERKHRLIPTTASKSLKII
jgi:hypothetical protein